MPSNRLTKFAAAACGAVGASVAVLALSSYGVPAAAPATARPAMISAQCAHAVDAAALPAETGVTITVAVPPTAVLRVDATGRVLAAMTNTGCVPGVGDDVYLRWPDDTVTVCTTLDVSSARWVGDFTQPGEFVPQNGDIVCS